MGRVIKNSIAGAANCVVKTAVLSVCLLWYTGKLSAQDGEYELVAHYNSENGLPQNSVSSLFTDKNGFIWFGTNNGMVRFDGRGFKIFNTIQYYPGASNRLQNIFKYGDRILAEESGLDVFFEITPESSVKAVEKGRLTGIWQNKSMYMDTGILQQFFSQHNFNVVYSATIDRSAMEGYSMGDEGQLISYYQVPSVYKSLDIKSPFSTNDYFIKKSRLYIFADKNGIKGFDKTIVLDAVEGSLPELIDAMNTDEKLACGFRQVDTSVYFYTNTSVYLIRERNPGVVDAELLTSKAFMNNKTDFLFLPEKNLLLIGTSNSGLYVFRRKAFSVLRFQENQNDIRVNNIFYTLQALNDSVILTDRGAFSTAGRPDLPMQGRFDPFSFPKTNTGDLIGRRSNVPGFFVYDSNLNVRHAVPIDSNSSFRGYVNDKDTLYLSADSARKTYIRKYLVKKDSGYRLLRIIPVTRELDVVNKMVKLRDNSLLLGTPIGLWILNLERFRYTKVPGMDTAIVRTMYQDKTGTVWIGTYARGWYRYRAETGLLRMPEDRDHNLSYVHGFAEDAGGYLWLSTNNGLFRFLLADLQQLTHAEQPLFYNYFTREYGFLTNEFNGGGDPSVITMRDGRIVFPGMNGLVLFNPGKIKAEIPDSLILIEEMALDNTTIQLSDDVVLPPDFNTLTFYVAIPYFGQHYNLQVEYQLSGGSTVWTQLPEDGVININRLTQGNYILTIRMLRGYGSREYIYKTIRFSVKPHWYQTNWFRITGLLLFAATLLLLARVRIKNIQRQKKHLEEVVSSRTKELEQRTHELEASEEKIRQNTQFKSQVTSLVLHDVRSPLYYLNKITGNIYQSTKGKVPEPIREELKDLHLSVKEISAYAQTLFAWISAQQDDFILSPSRIKLAGLLEEVCGNYQLLAAQNNNTISYGANPELSVVTQADLLQIVIRNLVDNAIKFTANGSITLSAVITGNEVFITVKDTGKGMAADRVYRILGIDADDTADTRSGMGYRLIRDLLKKMEGRLTIESELGKGSAITVILPVTAGHT